jgi:hypothetical protein
MQFEVVEQLFLVTFIAYEPFWVGLKLAFVAPDMGELPVVQFNHWYCAPETGEQFNMFPETLVFTTGFGFTVIVMSLE